MYKKEPFALVDLGIRVNLFYTISLNKAALISKSESVDNHWFNAKYAIVN